MAIIAVSISALIHAQETLPLYPGHIPGAIEGPDEEKSVNNNGILIVSKISRPTITVYRTSSQGRVRSSQTAVIVFPGGGYSINALQHEGHDVGRWLSEHGITAFVVKYRIPDKATMTDPETGPLQDAQQAIAFVRANAYKYGIRKDRIGVLGFSAGGHLAASASTHYKTKLVKYKNLRPDFSVLIYPVISFTDSIGHTGSRDNLLGKNASTEKISEWSNEMLVNRKTPPAFLAHAKDDWVNYKNSVYYADALKKYNIPVELLLFEKGGHGYGMINPQSEVQWTDALLAWLAKL
jgi:acetyl esterase/lipase